MPVRGVWKLVKSPGHQRFAFDLLAVDSDTRRASATSRFQHLLGRAHATDWYGWSKPVYAPIDGIVVRVSKSSPDRRELSLLRDVVAMIFSRPEMSSDDVRPFAGNHVIIQGDDFFVFLAHMQQRSVQVAQGDTVTAGQMIGRVGNSGFTLEPHLHFQLIDQIHDLATSTAPPFVVAQFERWTGRRWEPVIDGAFQKGNLIRFAAE